MDITSKSRDKRWISMEIVGKVFNDEGNFCQGEERNAFKVVGNQLFPS